MNKKIWKKKDGGFVCVFDDLARMIFENELINNGSVRWGQLKRRYKKFGLNEKWIEDHCNCDAQNFTLYTFGVLFDLPEDFLRVHFDRIHRICFSRALQNSSYITLDFVREYADRFTHDDWLALLRNSDCPLTLENEEFKDYFEACDWFEGYKIK